MRDERKLRRFGLSGVLVLVAGTAVGLVPVRFAASQVLYGDTGVQNVGPVRKVLQRLHVYGTPLVASWTLAVLAVGVAGPGAPPWRRSARRPGVVAGVAVALAVALSVTYFAAKEHASRGSVPPLLSQHYVNLMATSAHYSGLMVLGSWLALAMTGRWRTGPDWTDRLGVALGAWWPAVFLFDQSYFIITLFNS